MQSSDSELTTLDILNIFKQTLARCGGETDGVILDDHRLFARSVLPCIEQVRPGDGLKGGVAIKANDEGVCVYPYVFRLVCKNGAIMAHAIEGRQIQHIQCWDPQLATISIREGIEACCTPEVFADNVSRIRSGCGTDIDMVLNLAPLLARYGADNKIFAQVLDRFFRDGDRSRYGLANAVTATAREVREPELKWNLEELGGGVMIGAISTPPRNGRRAERAGRELVTTAG